MFLSPCLSPILTLELHLQKGGSLQGSGRWKLHWWWPSSSHHQLQFMMKIIDSKHKQVQSHLSNICNFCFQIWEPHPYTTVVTCWAEPWNVNGLPVPQWSFLSLVQQVAQLYSLNLIVPASKPTWDHISELDWAWSSPKIVWRPPKRGESNSLRTKIVLHVLLPGLSSLANIEEGPATVKVSANLSQSDCDLLSYQSSSLCLRALKDFWAVFSLG